MTIYDILMVATALLPIAIIFFLLIHLMPDHIVEKAIDDEWEDISEEDDELECARLRDMGLWEEDIKGHMERNSRLYYEERI